jgi:predicted metal-dependent peptidase
MSKGKGTKVDKATESFLEGLDLAQKHPLFGSLLTAPVIRPQHASTPVLCPREGWAVVVDDGQIHVHPTRRGTPAEWAYVLAHAALHLAFDHFHKRSSPHAWNAAACCVVTRFLEGLKFGHAPEEIQHVDEIPARPEVELYESFRQHGVPEGLRYLSLAGAEASDLYFSGSARIDRGAEWARRFADGLARAVDKAIATAAGSDTPEKERTPGYQARSWFINNYPLLGALAINFKIIEDPLVLTRAQISVGAVNPELREIYLNSQKLDSEEARFVMAHELLHVGLRHQARRQGRDPFLWNVACDYVINGWLLELGVGRLPRVGGLHDPQLKGLSAEAIYDRIVTDLRRYRKLCTLRGQGLSDILDGPRPDWWGTGIGIDLDALYRRCMAQGLEYHRDQGRGFLPADLVEEIRALSHPPIPWDVELARLFDAWFTPLEKSRTYARPSRRQASTPDIPRPRYHLRAEQFEHRTFGVILDSSGSMDRDLLARGLGAIASYAAARDVPLARVIFCDAAPYDQGYMPVEQIGLVPVKVRGRGGTVLQPAIDLLQSAKDFPDDGPILVITDGACDVLTLKRRHAFLIPEGRALPFVASGPVFRMS